MNAKKLMLLVSMTVLVCACTAYPRTAADFGNSARHMVNNQKIVTGPVDTTPVEGNDGQRMENVLEGYRENVSQREQVEQPVLINIGGQTQ